MYAIIKNGKIINPSAWQLSEEYQEIDFKYEEFIEMPEDYYIYDNGEVVINPNFDEEQIAKRKANFEEQFLLTSKGNYRLQPKGYANAQQSVDTINGMVEALGSLTEQIAEMVIFYPTPDFTKEEECTEEWLIAHQYNAEPMTQQQWIDFYIEFTTLYAQKQYKKERVIK